MNNTYYVYALKDPRCNPTKVFYIGKGTGNRAWEHSLKADETRKGIYIQDIISSGHSPTVTKLVTDLTETQALKIESELISSFGTIDTGGSLYNSVVPKGMTRRIQNNINVPTGVIDKAQIGLSLLKDAIEELSSANPDGISNSDAAHYLGLQSDNSGHQKDYLSYSLLGILIKERRLKKVKIGKRVKYKISDNL